jgi:hypothetical protein
LKSKHIPANLEAAEKAAQLIKDQLLILEKSTATKKRPSLQDSLNKERLQGLMVADSLTDDEMHRFGKFLDPKQRAKHINKRITILGKLNKDELVQKLAQVELDLLIEQGYAVVINRALDESWHKFEGDEYKKVKSSAKRQLGRQAIFEEDEKRLKECLSKVKKSKVGSLSSGDYVIFRSTVYLHYPESNLKQAPRLTGEFKDLTPEQQQEERDYLKEDSPGWSESRLRDFFTKHAKVKASTKNNF